ncbi:MAG TPA: hypothetical protein PKD78_15335, partial [Saprospiraceae bacterium]|nr:hypothetical protein [Saprospiraceae bacterium]
EGLLSTDLQRQPVVAFKNTSIATAFAAGMLALVRQSELERHLPTIACHDFLERLRHTASANKAITQGNDVGYGYGLLHPAALLQAVG